MNRTGSIRSIAVACAWLGVILAGPSQAGATQYFYQIENTTPFLGLTYENDAAYGGNGRSKFAVGFNALDLILIADDVTNTLSLSGTATGFFVPGASDLSNLGGIPAAVPGTYQFEARYINAGVANPATAQTTVYVTHGGQGDGYFKRIDGDPFYQSVDGTQGFWDMKASGIPPLPNLQLSDYSFGLQNVGGDRFRFDGWIHSGMIPGLAPFYHGDFHGFARYIGSDAPPADVPEPGTMVLMLSGLLGARARLKSSRSN